MVIYVFVIYGCLCFLIRTNTCVMKSVKRKCDILGIKRDCNWLGLDKV